MGNGNDMSLPAEMCFYMRKCQKGIGNDILKSLIYDLFTILYFHFLSTLSRRDISLLSLPSTESAGRLRKRHGNDKREIPIPPGSVVTRTG